MDFAGQDVAAVAAVRGGDVERYRELVERHERRVFAVAWSRLGDPALAEEATQEAFIRGYRRLGLLGDGTKFAAWITAIARHAAINLGLRHRRELNKRERWALEQAPGSDGAAGESAEPCTPEMLRKTLEELPAAHRECLVLFYLEGKSGAEAAAALGISESALRVRLHRARAALRERLEETLEGSLERLRPARTLVAPVMAGVLASSSAKAATGGTAALGAGAKLLSVLGKTSCCLWVVPLFSFITNIPALILVSVIGRKERENYRDAAGFRAKLHDGFFQSFLWGFPLFLLVFLGVTHSALGAWGIRPFQFVLASFVWAVTLIALRSLTVARSSFQVGMFVYCAMMAGGVSAVALGWIPQRLIPLPIASATVVLLIFYEKRPLRMDYSLFLRAAQGLMNSTEAARGAPQPGHLDRQELLAFARFLGSRFLVNNYRWDSAGLALRLPPVRSRFLSNMATVFMPPISRNCSRVALGWDGSVRSHCGLTDTNDLAALGSSFVTNARELEARVAEKVAQAWREFRGGNLVEAERLLGEVPESEVFVVPPARAKALRWWRVWIGASIALLLLSVCLQFWPPAWLSGLRPVSLHEPQVRAFLNDTAPDPDPKKFKSNSPGLALFTCLVLPPTHLFDAAGLRAMRAEVTGESDFEHWRLSGAQVQGIFSRPSLQRALTGGWLGWGELGITPEEASTALRTNRWMWMNSRENWEYFLSRGESWSWVKRERFSVKRIYSGGLTQLRLLRDLHCLDLVDREKLIRQIASVQTLSGTPPGQPPIHDWKDVRGLFFTPCWPALQDTYLSLAALEILGGLDRIDREQCIRGILRVHRGKGFFTSPDSGGFNEYHIEGDARDTIAAFESLRILGALDRVKDLDQWQFRPQRRGVAKGQFTWQDIEAWVAQQRLEKILRERKEHPQAPVDSLLND